ncbi:MAG TPA: DUF448 domain-containing protein [Actinobacteria bacterium]|nr:DUF448 domain-containing protein [Actinomycetota bacterium]
MAKTKSPAQRTCIGCREVKPKKHLIRIVRTPERDIIVDPTGKANGRGAYVCPSRACLTAATKSGRLAKALDTEIAKETLERIIDDVQVLLGDKGTK